MYVAVLEDSQVDAACPQLLYTQQIDAAWFFAARLTGALPSGHGACWWGGLKAGLF